jgi:hypothetical protein
MPNDKKIEMTTEDYKDIMGLDFIPDEDIKPPTPEEMEYIKNLPEYSGKSSTLGSIGKLVASGGKKLAQGVGGALSYVDKRSLYPFLAANRALQKGNNPISAAYSQYGKDLNPDNSSKAILEDAGVPAEDPNAQPVNVPMVGTIYPSKKPSSSLGRAYEMIEHPLNWIAGEQVAKGIGKAVEVAKPATAEVVSTIGHTLTGTPKQVLKTYIKNRPEINSMISKSGGDTQALVDAWRDKMISDVKRAKVGFNAQIEAGIKSGEGTGIESNSIAEALEAHKSKLDPIGNAGDIEQINNFVNKINKYGVEGIVDVKDLYRMKRMLQKRAAGSYRDGGQIFQVGPEASNAAKSGAGVAADTVHTLSPEIEAADEGLAGLHGAMRDIKRNTFVPGKHQGSALAAGSGNPTQRAALSKLDEVAGTNTLEEADKLAAAAHMAEPPLLPTDTTGKTVARQVMGHQIAQNLPGGLAKGAITAATMGLTSPAVWKMGINAVGGGIGMGQKLLRSPGTKPIMAGASGMNRILQKTNANPEVQAKWGDSLAKSAQQGEDKFIKDYFVKQSTDPSFREYMKSMDEEDDAIEQSMY